MKLTSSVHVSCRWRIKEKFLFAKSARADKEGEPSRLKFLREEGNLSHYYRAVRDELLDLAQKGKLTGAVDASSEQADQQQGEDASAEAEMTIESIRSTKGRQLMEESDQSSSGMQTNEKKRKRNRWGFKADSAPRTD